MLYAGIDLHREYLVVVVLDRGGAVVDERRLPSDAEVVRAYFAELGEPVQAVVEAMGSWHWLYDVLTAEGIPSTLAHPWKLRAIAAAKLKNDQVDVRMLAHLDRTGLIPAAYGAPPAVRTLRELLRHRAALVRTGTQLKNRVRSLLAQRNVSLVGRSLMARRTRQELAAVALGLVARQEVTHCLALLDTVAGQVSELDAEIRGRACDDPQATLLMTVPGIGYYLAVPRQNLIRQYGTSRRRGEAGARVVSFSRHSAHRTAPRYDTDAQNTALMRQFVVSDLVSDRHGVQEVTGSLLRLVRHRD